MVAGWVLSSETTAFDLIHAQFVRDVAPGEVVEVELTEVKKRFARARLLKILQSSLERVTPACQYFGECGGCQYQHLAYPVQLRIKHKQICDLFQRIGGFAFLQQLFRLLDQLGGLSPVGVMVHFAQRANPAGPPPSATQGRAESGVARGGGRVDRPTRFVFSEQFFSPAPPRGNRAGEVAFRRNEIFD